MPNKLFKNHYNTDLVSGDLTGPGLDSRYMTGSSPTSEPRVLTSLPGYLRNTRAQNALPTIQDNVIVHDGVQFAVWVDDSLNPIIGKRTLPYGAWSTFDLSTIPGNPLNAPTDDDLHNSYSIATDGDGYIHLSGNHHDGPDLQYVRSATPGSITSWVEPGMVGTEEGDVTYPQFVRFADDELIFMYRDGSSGNGNTYINAYNTEAQTWSRRCLLFRGMTPTSPDENAYNNHLAVGDDDVLHVFYVWRTTADVTTTHDIGHVKSADNGATWTLANGTAVTLPITPATSAPLFITGNQEFLNSCGADVDSAGRPHAAMWFRQASAYTSRLTHMWWDGAAWQTTEEVRVLDPGIPTIDMARPSVFCHGDRTFVLYSSDTTNRTAWWCEDISPSPAVRLPRFKLIDTDLGLYEPTFDTRSVRERDELHLLVTPISPDLVDVDSDYLAQWGAILSVDLTRIDELARTEAPRNTVTVGDEEWWVPAAEWSNSSGSPTYNASTLGTNAWLLDAAAVEVLNAVTYVPTGWTTFDIDLWWTNASSGSGNVRVNTRYFRHIEGQNLTGDQINVGDVTLTAPAQNIYEVTSVVTDVPRKANGILRLSFRRLGSDALDTLGNDIGFLGFMLRKAS